MTPAVEELCRKVWEAREVDPRRLSASDISRRMYAAITVDLVRHGGYDPETDRRIAWLREVMMSIRIHARRIEAHPDLEQAVRFLLGIDEPALEWSARRRGKKVTTPTPESKNHGP